MSSLTIKVKPSYNHALTHHQLEGKNEKGFYSSIYPKYNLIFGTAFTSHLESCQRFFLLANQIASSTCLAGN